MRDFEFLEPATVAEASRMLADLGDRCRIFAGGTALMLGMRQRMLTPSHLVSLTQVPTAAMRASCARRPSIDRWQAWRWRCDAKAPSVSKRGWR